MTISSTTSEARPVGTTGVLPAAQVPVLLVDDNAAKRLAIRAVLSPLGFLIVEADSGLDALRCVMARDFAVILLDVRMPVMDGFETAALIRLRWQSEMTPIIFITSYASDELVNADRYAEGAVDFIFAPVPPDELRAKVSVFANLFTKADELARRAREVQASADEWRLLTDSAPIGIFQTDVDNRYVYTNPRWSEITGMPAAEAAGRPWDAIVSEDQRADLTAKLADGPAHRVEISHRFELRTAGCPPRIVLVTSTSVPASRGGTSGWVGTLADVTAEAGAEAAMSTARDDATAASQLKSDFLANMSHEIRTPMNGVIGMTDLLLETDLDARQRDYAQTVRNSGEALLTIINDILDFSKVEAGKLELENIEFSIPAIVDDVVDLLADTAQSKGIELVGIVAGSVPAVVSGDPGRVRQVLTNLVGNAIKFTRTGEIVVRVTTAEVAGTGTGIRFEVADTGDGIAPDKLETVFQPFVQGDTSTSRKYGGTGLGLAISGQLVALMSGDCGVSSELGLGSTFWFTISVQAAPGQAKTEVVAPDPDLAGVTILVVDDSATLRSVLTGYLGAWGMTVRSAKSGPAALATLRTASIQGRPFDLALVDRTMPGMDGLELKKAILDDASLSVRPIMMTALSQEKNLDPGAPSGSCPWVSKPVHRDNLRTCLLAELGRPVAHLAPGAVSPTGQSDVDESSVGHLLLAEDNLINQKVAIAILSGAGYVVDTVPNGQAAVAAAASTRYDAVLMDCQMPVLNGYEATAAIREREGADRHTPIIAMTAGARREDRDRCLAEGMDSYLAKPINKDALLALVARYVKEGPARSQAISPVDGRAPNGKAAQPGVLA